uniref:hypothetical protein n=1 Tax=Cellulomonas hominis TaxID=156981 RepID=UPI0018AB192D
ARAARRVLSGCDDVRPAGDLTARLLALGGAPVPSGADAVARPGGARPMDPFVPPSAVRGAAAFTGSAPATSGIGGLLGGRGPFGEGVLGGRSVLGGHSVLGGSVLGSRRLLGDRPVVGSAPGATAAGATRRGLRAAVGSLTGLGVVAVGLFLLGDRPTVAPATQSAEALSLLGEAGPAAVPVVAAGSEGAAPAAGATTRDYLDWMRAEGWTCPEQVPAGWAVTAVHLRDDGGTLEVDLSGPTGDVVVTEQHGRLDVSALTAAEPIDVEGRTVYLLSAEPWHAAWQSGDTVVEVVSSRTGAGAAAVVAQFPEGEFDAGLSARLTRGWDTFATAVHLP